ncbi:hypothetical protein T4D_3830 [Trichinella pseudospiralis]|uniref:Uncharacterized protein n=1 Tax=Trichinella pseudospiralis TaxID=6337 RepID=A0A0V1F428_TRIPS|nr:hypothetical protein T4D_15495 [Trichinella pseudospiralis]KRY80816.1 hypothetical protein T4D_3830 [Trichinella pseudospiralis]
MNGLQSWRFAHLNTLRPSVFKWYIGNNHKRNIAQTGFRKSIHYTWKTDYKEKKQSIASHQTFTQQNAANATMEN